MNRINPKLDQHCQPRINKGNLAEQTWSEFDTIMSRIRSSSLQKALKATLCTIQVALLSYLQPIEAQTIELTPTEITELIKPSPNSYSTMPYARLPLGLPNGWGPYGELDGLIVTNAPGEYPPKTSLRIISKDTSQNSVVTTFSCGVFRVPAASVNYTLRIRAKSLQPGSTLEAKMTKNDTQDYVTYPNNVYAQTVSTSSYSNIDWPIVTPPGANYVYLVLFVKGDIIIESIYCGPSANVAESPYSVPQVTFGMPDNNAQHLARVFFDDEPVRLKVHASGWTYPNQLTLQSRVITAYGISYPMSDMMISSTSSEWANDNYYPLTAIGLPANRQLGSYRVEAWLTQGGARISAVQEYVVHRIPRPKYWTQAGPQAGFASKFGIGTTIDPTRLTMSKAVGLNWIRTEPHDPFLKWTSIQPNNDQQWLWDYSDKRTNVISRIKLNVLAIMGQTPRWAATMPGAPGPYHAPTTTNAYYPFPDVYNAWTAPRYMGQFGNYVNNVAAKYSNIIDAYDVWNEPWYVGSLTRDWVYSDASNIFWRWTFPNLPEYEFRDMAASVGYGVSQYDPGSTIVAEGLGYGITDATSVSISSADQIPNWETLSLNTGINIYSTVEYSHTYVSNPMLVYGDNFEQVETNSARLLANRSVPIARKPKWNTEGSPMQKILKQGMHLRTYHYDGTEDFLQEGNLMARYLAASVASGYEKTFLYSTTPQWYSPDYIEWNTLCVGGGWMHPVGVSIAVATANLEGKNFVKRNSLALGVYATFFSDANGAVAAISTAPSYSPWTIPSGITSVATLSDVFGNSLAAGQGVTDKLVWIKGPSVAALESFLPNTSGTFEYVSNGGVSGPQQPTGWAFGPDTSYSGAGSLYTWGWNCWSGGPLNSVLKGSQIRVQFDYRAAISNEGVKFTVVAGSSMWTSNNPNGQPIQSTDPNIWSHYDSGWVNINSADYNGIKSLYILASPVVGGSGRGYFDNISLTAR